MKSLIILRGGGDLASGVALRLHRAGFPLLITELEKPIMVRRTVSFAEAIYAGSVTIEGQLAKQIQSWQAAQEAIAAGHIPVIIDPQFSILKGQHPLAIIDARMLKEKVKSNMQATDFLIGLGPGFEVAVNCHAIVETKRGHHLGRVLWQGKAVDNTGIPGSIATHKRDRVLRAPISGKLRAHAAIGQMMKQNDLIASINSAEIRAPFDGVLRGLIHPSVSITEAMKIADLDPRSDPSYVNLVSDKALAIAGGVLEALLSRSNIRKALLT